MKTTFQLGHAPLAYTSTHCLRWRTPTPTIVPVGHMSCNAGEQWPCDIMHNTNNDLTTQVSKARSWYPSRFTLLIHPVVPLKHSRAGQSIFKVPQSPACPHPTGRIPLPFSDQVSQLLLFSSGSPVRRTMARSGTCAPSHPEWRGKYPVPRNPAMRGKAEEHGEAIKPDPTMSANAMLPIPASASSSYRQC